MSNIQDLVTRTLKDTISDGRPEPGQLYSFIAGVTIETFLKAAAEQGWHMRPDEVTEEMIDAVIEPSGIDDYYRIMSAAAPPFKWKSDS